MGPNNLIFVFDSQKKLSLNQTRDRKKNNPNSILFSVTSNQNLVVIYLVHIVVTLACTVYVPLKELTAIMSLYSSCGGHLENQ